MTYDQLFTLLCFALMACAWLAVSLSQSKKQVEQYRDTVTDLSNQIDSLKNDRSSI